MMTPNAGVKRYSFCVRYMLYANEEILFTGLEEKDGPSGLYC